MSYTKRQKQAQKPALPQTQRVKYVLEDVEDLYQQLISLDGKPAGDEGEIVWKNYVKACIRLVHLDNSQLKNPALQPLLSSPKVKGRNLLRKIHRGLEKGVQRPLTEKEIEVSKAIEDGFNEGHSLQQILNRLTRPKRLGDKPLLKRMSIQNFYKLKTRLLPALEKASPDLVLSRRADRQLSQQLLPHSHGKSVPKKK
jgi:hypothetical protein